MTQTRNPEYIDAIVDFYRDYYHEEIAKLAQRYPNDQRSLVIDWMDIYRCEPDIAEDVQNHPGEILDYFEEALRMYDLPIDVRFSNAHVRVTNLESSRQFNVGETRSDHREKLVAIRGQVSKRTDVKPKAKGLAFECQRCGTNTHVPQNGTERQEPHECQGCERQGPFLIDFDQSELVDHQLLRVKEPPEEAQGGQGSYIDVMLEDDAVEVADAGDRVTVTGELKLEETDSDSLTFDKYLEGNSVTVEETDFEEIDVEEYMEIIEAIANGEYGPPVEALVDSFAPKIRGYEDIKEAIILQLFSGTAVDFPDGGRARGDFHILVLGDPGCGKSTLLRAAEEIAPRSTYASGKGASAAGMTAAAVRDDFGDTEWGLEAGALVVADKGIACVDEIDKIQEDAVSSLHNALESQRVNISKAGINTKLPARTSLLAAGNPKYGRFDQYESVAEQIDLDPPLLSRFDLMFMLTDEPDPDQDADVAGHIIETRELANKYTYAEGEPDADLSKIEPTIEADALRAYIAYAKQNMHPCVSTKQKEELKDWYVELRNSNTEDGPVAVTARKVEAMCRLAEASAKARLSSSVEPEDLERARRLVMKSMREVGVDPETEEFDADMIEAGTSNAQRDRIRNIMSIVGELEDEYNKGAPMDVVLERALDLDMGKNQAEHEIEKLKQQGELYEPRDDGHLRTTE